MLSSYVFGSTADEGSLASPIQKDTLWATKDYHYLYLTTSSRSTSDSSEVSSSGVAQHGSDSSI